MKNCRKSFLALGLALGIVSTAWCEGTVTLRRVQQRYPWNGLVDMDYTIEGVEYPADYTLDFTITAAVGDGQLVHVATNFLTYAACDLPMDNGGHRVTWNATADGLEFLSRSVSVKAKLTYAPVAQAQADYMIVDLASSTTAFAARYVRNTEPSAFNMDLYKTDRLVLRRVSRDEGSFFLGLFETTRCQAGWTYSQASWRSTDKMKAIGMKWDGSKSYVIDRLNAKVQHKGTAITTFAFSPEADWEYACRAGTTTTYSYGDDASILGEYAWYADNSGGAINIVGQLKPNPWGFYDMHGNVAEWCAELWDPSSERSRVDRGGRYNLAAQYCGSDRREGNWASDSTHYGDKIGYRVYLPIAAE